MGFFEGLDEGVTGLVGQWNGYSTGLFTLLVLLISYRVTTARDPDVHPMLLARQSTPATVRNEGESAIYRSLAVPHGMPLISGLGVKDAGDSRWSRGRDGDLRDVWRKAVAGNDAGARGRLLTVLGRENVVEHKLEDVTKQINLIGRHIAEQGAIRVAVYLPNSVEFLVTVMACAFFPYLTTVLIPFNVSDEELISMVRRSAVDTVVTAPGSFPLDAVAKACPSLRELIWVLDEGSSHLDWNEVPEGMGGRVNVATWQDIIRDGSSADTSADAGQLPEPDPSRAPTDLVAFWQSRPGQLEEMVRFTQANLVAGIAAQIAAIPTRERMGAGDLFLPAESLAGMHTLVLTLAALYSNASIAFNSVAGRSTDLVLATQGVAPTVVVAGPAALLKTHAESAAALGGSPLARAAHALATRALTQQGVHGSSNVLSAFAAGARPPIGTAPGKLRLLYTAERAGTETPHLPAGVLSDLRVFTGAKLVYALTSPRVAGSISQTAVFDYRVDEASPRGHFGAPASSVEVYLKDMGPYKTTDDKVEGETKETS
ncbi:hypothetical protein ESCO_000495 [Escovopsis weberi]|uniref:AMP-dependent synthetase/ligase domain-containing protein n=1 Tax=Escovopsis weberi TaxID=150374 RepID=A0A0M8MWU5_ESCWE|nr:hypothetical protein ESCO_000495 [Escovopsis weberi]